MTKKLTRKVLPFSLLILAVPFLVFAAPFNVLAAPVISMDILSENTEAIIGLVLCVIAVVAAYYSFTIAPLYKGGVLEKTWKRIAVVALLYAVLQIMLSLEEFGIVEFGGLDEFVEIAMTIMMLYSFYTARKELMAQMGGKK